MKPLSSIKNFFCDVLGIEIKEEKALREQIRRSQKKGNKRLLMKRKKQESIRLPIDLNEYFFRTKEDIAEHSIEIEMAYQYFVISSDPQKRKVRRCYIVTDRLRVN